MGLLSKIFGTSSNSVDTEIKREDKQNPVMYYKNKYKQMEAEGKQIDWWEFNQSVDNRWPYPVATEAERKAIDGIEYRVLKGHAIDISNLLYSYQLGMLEDANDGDVTIYKDEDKVAYWKNELIKGAENGDKSFQAALITNLGIYGGTSSGWMSEEEVACYKEKYEQKLIENAREGDGAALYAIAQFALCDAKYGSVERKEYAEKALAAGNGDAAYLLAEIYKTESYKNGGDWEYSEVLKFYLKGVETDNGAMLGRMQDCIADAYRDGEDGFPKDVEKAIYYYNEAINNGDSSAKATMELAENHPELFQ